MTKLSHEIAKDRTVSGSEFIGVDFAPDDPARPFWVWSGVGYHTHAARISAGELLGDWPEHYGLVKTWLGPVLSRLASGAPLDPADVLLAYSAYHGKEAPVASTGA
jgi:hypothetical protein